MSKTDSLGSFQFIPRSLLAGDASQNSLLPKCILAHDRHTLGWKNETMRESQYGIWRMGTLNDGLSAFIVLAISFHHI